ncbi:MAG: undecaprenyl/decaprenyl-phosphate alpha-N-acetylglucosaminyl 1-phosphate transferase [Saprospiraceae bacterium]|nr:undecaprenyl/decaprenyl-phosphate alpha-N-acetylglucosaminyl 1-phosphate transferase [Saprospiraceae bacterium]
MYDVLLSFITAFTLTFVAIPSIINVAKVKHLMDEPGERRSHTDSIPTLGGIGIFAGVIFSIVLWTPFGVFQDLQYILCAFVIIFLIGAKDDLVPMSPWRKLAGQLFAAFILVYKANVRLTSFYGLFGITLLPDMISYAFSIFTILVIINSFNLIDGINGLTGSISTLISLVLGVWFFLVDQLDLAIVAFALAGSVLAFMRYNVTPAKIFMGDTGSLFVGLVCAILTIKFIEVHRELSGSIYAVRSAPAVAIGILILPLFDTLRVFTIRILRGHSPLSPDRRHIHHMMIDAGFSHMQATGILILSNIAFIVIALKYQNLGNFQLLILILSMALILTALLHFYVRRKKARERTLI